MNEVQVNAFQFSKVDLLPMYVFNNRNIEPTIDLLLLFNEDVHHYVLIINLIKLVCTVKEKQFTNSLRLCRNCFAFSHSEEQHQVHDDACRNHAPATIKMPGDDKNSFRFKNFKARWFAPITIYFDFESFLMPVSSCPANPDASSTEVIEQHIPSGFALTLIENGYSTPKEFVIDSSENCMTNFIKKLHEMAREVYYSKRRFPIYLGQQVPNRSSIVDCWICEEPFGPEDTKVMDHCHHRGDFLGFAHEKGNWIRRTINFTPVIGHNIANYDLHHVCLALREIEPSTKINVIPSTDEKYISMTFGVLIKTVTGRDGKDRKIYEYLRFIDSFKFLTTSLEKLIANLPASALAIFDSMFDSDRSVS